MVPDIEPALYLAIAAQKLRVEYIMSQSDYIERKRAAIILNRQDQFPSTLSPSEYTAFKTFSLTNTIASSTVTYSALVPSDKTCIFDMICNKTGCSNLTLCSGTDTRVFRVPMQAAYAFRQSATPLYAKKGYKCCD